MQPIGAALKVMLAVGLTTGMVLFAGNGTVCAQDSCGEQYARCAKACPCTLKQPFGRGCLLRDVGCDANCRAQQTTCSALGGLVGGQ